MTAVGVAPVGVGWSAGELEQPATVFTMAMPSTPDPAAKSSRRRLSVKSLMPDDYRRKCPGPGSADQVRTRASHSLRVRRAATDSVAFG